MKEFNDIELSRVDANEDYTMRLARRVIEILKAKPVPIEEVYTHCDGAFPTDVLCVITSLASSGVIVHNGDLLSLSRERHSRKTNPTEVSNGDIGGSRTTEAFQTRKILDSLADPHPADYDWRFTSETIDFIADYFGVGLGTRRIALFGVPTLLCRFTGKDVTLFDRSAALINDLTRVGLRSELRIHDLFDPIVGADASFDVVVADPPWYVEFYKGFLLRSAQILKQDAILYLSVLPRLTRSSAIEDRFEIVEFASRCGFDLAEIQPGVLQYASPQFEQTVLKRNDIRCRDWRTGDAFIFRYVKGPQQGLSAPRPPDEPEWDDFRFGRKRVKLRRKSFALGSRFTILPVSENGYPFDSVSRRAVLRSRVDLWTSDNRAFTTDRVDVLREALHRLSAGEDPSNIVSGLRDRSLVSEDVAQGLIDILRDLQSGDQLRAKLKNEL
jgi:hypothetical protein